MPNYVLRAVVASWRHGAGCAPLARRDITSNYQTSIRKKIAIDDHIQSGSTESRNRKTSKFPIEPSLDSLRRMAMASELATFGDPLYFDAAGPRNAGTGEPAQIVGGQRAATTAAVTEWNRNANNLLRGPMLTTVKRLMPDSLLDAAKFVHYPIMLATGKLEDEPEMAGLRHFVRQGDCVVDIGANLGAYTHLLSRLVGPAGTVHAFEPIPRTFSLLQWSTRILGRRNVVLHQCALSHTSGSAQMNIPRNRTTGRKNYYMASVAVAAAECDAVQMVTDVPLRTLPEELPSPRRAVTFIKCDVEGHELAVFKGASDILAVDKPAILIEISGDPDDIASPSGELFTMFRMHGYEPFVYRDASFHGRQHGDRYVNYFFLTPAHTTGLTSAAKSQ